MREPTICPYCGAHNSLVYWETVKSSQVDLKGNKMLLDRKLPLPRCSSCKNTLRYYYNAYRDKVYVKNPKGL